MVTWTVAEFAECAQGTLGNTDGSQPILGFATDSRDVRPGFIFIAIRGERVDGHDFVEQAFAQGAVAVLAERPVAGPHVLVNSVVDALASGARVVRSEFSGPVVGVTGSNGKTTTKEFVAAALSPLGPVLKNEGNRNSEYTSPLVWFDVSSAHRAAVIEMGMRGFGQIAHLAAFSQPTIGLITTIGTAHIEMVGSRAGIARAKGELLQALPANGVAVLPADDDFLGDLRALSTAPVRTFGFAPEADCRVIGYRALGAQSCVVMGSLDGEAWEVTLPAIGRHQASNAAAAILAAHSAGVSVADAAAALPTAELPAMRLEVIERDGVTILLDTYNASPDSTVAALNALAELPCDGRRYAVLGEMRELGDFTESGHRLVGSALARSGIQTALLTGGPTRFIADEARRAGFASAEIQELEEPNLVEIRQFLDGLQSGDVVLIKASRALGLERALEVLA